MREKVVGRWLDWRSTCALGSDLPVGAQNGLGHLCRLPQRGVDRAPAFGSSGVCHGGCILSAHSGRVALCQRVIQLPAAAENTSGTGNGASDGHLPISSKHPTLGVRGGGGGACGGWPWRVGCYHASENLAMHHQLDMLAAFRRAALSTSLFITTAQLRIAMLQCMALIQFCSPYFIEQNTR